MRRYLSKLLRLFGLKIVRYSVIPYNKRILENYQVFSHLIKIVDESAVQGALVECGFGYGRSFAVMSHFAVESNRKIWGIDSFVGFPNVSDFDLSSRNPKNGEWYVRSLAEARESINSLGIFEDEDDFQLIKLIFDEYTNNPIPDEKIALLHIDLDLYQGYKHALEIFWDQLQCGGIVLFDEYDDVKWPGATRAINEFLDNKNISLDQIIKLRSKHYIQKR